MRGLEKWKKNRSRDCVCIPTPVIEKYHFAVVDETTDSFTISSEEQEIDTERECTYVSCTSDRGTKREVLGRPELVGHILGRARLVSPPTGPVSAATLVGKRRSMQT